MKYYCLSYWIGDNRMALLKVPKSVDFSPPISFELCEPKGMDYILYYGPFVDLIGDQ